MNNKTTDNQKLNNLITLTERLEPIISSEKTGVGTKVEAISQYRHIYREIANVFFPLSIIYPN